MERNNEFLLQFTPELGCSWGECQTITTLGIASKDGSYIRLEPVCPLHGYMGLVPTPSEAEIQEHQYTIKRFVLSEKDNQGEVTEVVHVELDELEAHGIEVFRGEKYYMADDAWRVVYQRDGAQDTYYVKWSDEYMEFELCEVKA